MIWDAMLKHVVSEAFKIGTRVESSVSCRSFVLVNRIPPGTSGTDRRIERILCMIETDWAERWAVSETLYATSDPRDDRGKEWERDSASADAADKRAILRSRIIQSTASRGEGETKVVRVGLFNAVTLFPCFELFRYPIAIADMTHLLYLTQL